MKRTFITIMLVLLWAWPAAAEDFTKWSWATVNWRICEGVALNESYRTDVRVKVEEVGDDLKLSNLTASLSLAAASKTMATGKLEVRKGDETLQTVTLEEPWYSMISEPNAGPVLTLPRVRSSESPSPADAQVLTVPKGSSLVFKLTPTVDTAIGACVLAGTEHEVELAR